MSVLLSKQKHFTFCVGSLFEATDVADINYGASKISGAVSTSTILSANVTTNSNTDLIVFF